jgi:DNA-binding transcriptional LysR family regulator
LISAIQAGKSGSFSAAANVLGLTPAAVSRNVAALEAHLMMRLFNRTTRRLSLIEEGLAFVAQARVGVQALEDANALATQGAQPEGLVARKICDVPAVLVVTPEYLKAYGTPRTPEDLAGHRLIRVRFLNGRMSTWTFKSGKAKAVSTQDYPA